MHSNHLPLQFLKETRRHNQLQPFQILIQNSQASYFWNGLDLFWGVLPVRVRHPHPESAVNVILTLGYEGSFSVCLGAQ